MMRRLFLTAIPAVLAGFTYRGICRSGKLIELARIRTCPRRPHARF
jgi:hypothetical protein